MSLKYFLTLSLVVWKNSLTNIKKEISVLLSYHIPLYYKLLSSWPSTLPATKIMHWAIKDRKSSKIWELAITHVLIKNYYKYVYPNNPRETWFFTSTRSVKLDWWPQQISSSRPLLLYSFFFSSSSSFLLPGFIFKNVLNSIFSITAAARLRKNKYKKGSLHVNY